jgi:TonB family protein
MPYSMSKLQLSVFFSFLTFQGQSQVLKLDTLYFPANVPKEKAVNFRTIAVEDSNHYRLSYFKPNGAPLFSTAVKPVPKKGGGLSVELGEAIQDGHFYSYHPSGTISVEGGMRDNIHVGEWRTYYKSGAIKSVEIYSENESRKKVVNYDEQQNITSEGGKLKSAKNKYVYIPDGLWKYYYPNSTKLYYVKFFSEGVLNGPYGQYDEISGKVRKKGKYKEGKIDGEWESYDENGKPIQKVTFVTGKRDGPCTFHSSDLMVITGQYEKDKCERKWNMFYEGSSKLAGEIDYLNDFGKVVYYDTSTGAIRTVGGYRGRLRHGDYKRYYIGTAKVKDAFTYQNGLAEGSDIEYDSLGNITKETRYLHGRRYGPTKQNYAGGINRWMEVDYVNDTLHGYLKVLYPNKQLKRYSKYDRGNLVEETCYSSEGQVIPCLPFRSDAVFQGNMADYIGKNLRYPQEAKEQKLEGKVVVSFIVNEYGEIDEISIEKGLSEECDDEAIRLVKQMPKWNPAEIDGQTFAVKKTVPIVFWLKDGEAE